nr:unnamed protein product [Callosobruchus chinensis]
MIYFGKFVVGIDSFFIRNRKKPETLDGIQLIKDGVKKEPGSNSIDGSADSYGYGYSGSFSGGAPSNFPFPNFDFSNFFNGYLADLNKFHTEFMKKGGGMISYSYASGGNAQASSSISFNNGYSLQAQAQQAANAGGGSGGFGGSFAGSGPGGGGFAASGGGPVSGGFGGGFFGPGAGGNGFSFSGGAPETGQPGGFKSVSTFSSSHTSNVNGVPQTVQQATSTINDNGKITTYTAKNP